MSQSDVKQFLVMWNRYVYGSCHLERGKSEFVDWAIGKMFGKEFREAFFELLTTSENVKDMMITNVEAFMKEFEKPKELELCFAMCGLDGMVSVLRVSDNKVIEIVEKEVLAGLEMKNGHFLWDTHAKG